MRCPTNFRNALELFLFFISLSFPIACVAKTSSPVFAKSWMAVDSLMRIGLTQTALDTVIRLHKQAASSENPDQLIKAIIYRMRLESVKEEDAFVKTLTRLNAEIAGAKFPVTPVLHSMLAECYQRYYENNRWRFFNRTQTITADPGDIHTWDLRSIIDKMTREFEMSLQNPEVLKKTPLSVYDQAVTDTGINVNLRPTLYDFLAHRAIDFYSIDDIGLTKPASEFTMNDSRYFEPFEKFTQIKLTNDDTASLQFHALKLLQDLIVFHSDNNEVEALIDADIARLSFVRQHASIPDKDSLYLRALVSLENLAPYSPASAEVTYRIALLYREWADSYVWEKNERYRWLNKESLRMCEKASKTFPGSFGAKQCANLSAQITSKAMTFTNESVNVPGKSFKMLVSYKNIPRIFWRQIPITIEDFQRILQGDSVGVRLAALKPINEWSSDLPAQGDFQNHSVEVEAPGLPLGHYALLCASDPQFRFASQAMAFATTQVSRLSYVERKNENGGEEFLVLDRETGAPLKGATAKVWSRTYDDKLRVYKLVSKGSSTTDKEGRVMITASGNSYESRVIDFYLSNDRLRAGGEYYLYPMRSKPEKMILRTCFFTDRAIYRPGQTIYFKGIMLRTDGDRNEIAPKENTAVRFYNVNGQEIGKLELTSNDFGSIHGSFAAPLTGLNGQMYITDGHGTSYVSVEEYKRPSFEVTLDPPKGLGKLGEAVKFAGRAKAYAGNTIDGAKVNYRVVRVTRLPEWSRRWRPPSWGTETEIAGGTTLTDDTGGFTVEFKAVPDASAPVSENPVFTYRLSVDVTDISGETRSSGASINLGYVPLVLDIAIPALVRKGSDTVFSITTENLSGVFEPAQGVIFIYRLKTPSKVFRNRLWQSPDTTSMTEARHASMFPTDLYENETDSTQWEKSDTVFEGKFDTRQSKEFKLSQADHWNQGVYVLEGRAKDASGQDVKNVKYFVLFSEKEKSLPYPRPDWFVPIKAKCEVGEKAVFLIGSGYDNVKILFEVERKGEIVGKQWLSLSNGQTKVEIPVEEKHRGNVSVNFTFVHDNRVFQHNAVVVVPWTNKELSISFETFRDKLKPGENEEWRLRIAGKNKDKIAAEMAATLYDASLDSFRPINWNFSINPVYGSTRAWNTYQGFDNQQANCLKNKWNDIPGLPVMEYPAFNWFGYGFMGGRLYHGKGYGGGYGAMDEEEISAMVPVSRELKKGSRAETQVAKAKSAGGIGFGAQAPKGFLGGGGQKKKGTNTLALAGQNSAEPEHNLSTIVARTNLNETAFFYPCLQTDEKGEIIVKFKIPEALTKWKMLGLAHTKNLSCGLISKELVTQKDLMVMPHLPRFFREGDKITVTAAVSNLADKDLVGSGRLLLFDAATMTPVDSPFKNTAAQIPFNVKKGQSAPLAWDLNVPEGMGAIVVRIAAQSGDFSDAEEQTLPILTNRMPVTESIPLSIRKKETNKFTFANLVSGNGNSSTLRNYRLTLEFSSNPLWYAIQALPYLMEYPYECAEQTFGRFYANAIASHLANSSPSIKAVFDQWRSQSPDALLSNLEKNQELKNLLLEETPWLLDGKNESERKKRVALLFDLNTMTREQDAALSRLQKLQLPSGGWPWFEGMPADRFITQYITTGLGRLIHLGILDQAAGGATREILTRCLRYCDDRMVDDYESLERCCKADLDKNHLGELQTQYLYMRSFFTDSPLEPRYQKALEYYRGQAKRYWVDKSRYLQGMIALALFRRGETAPPVAIIRSLKENAIISTEMGMYWKEIYEGSSWWWHAPIETQALMVEAFDEVAHDNAAVEDLKAWLLKSKQTQNWRTTKATAEACYALLLRGNNLLDQPSNVTIRLGDTVIDEAYRKSAGAEPGTGYFKLSWQGPEIKAGMGSISVTKQEPGVAWGALYWQYFEQLDKIKQHETPLKLSKKLFLRQNSPTGPKMTPVEATTALKPGDKLTVRIELRVDRDMEYVHMKDMRAAGLEPLNVFSGYRFQDGLGYYESTRDAATNFFFSSVHKGTYVFEYPLIVAHAGDFSNGITTIQCMYAPEFTSHSEGVRVKVER
jgi:hypothetical protein